MKDLKLNLEPIFCHAKSIESIITKHPTWKSFHGKRLSVNNDYTSQREWTGNLNTSTCNIQQLWVFGQLEASELLGISSTYFSDLSVDSGITMLRPCKRLEGVTVDINMEEEQEDSFYEAQEKDEDNDASLEIEELLEDSGGYDMESNIQHPITCRIGDKPIYKATMVKDVLNGDTQVSSADRLRRVRGYSKTPCSFENLDDENNLDLDDVLMLGDVVAAKLIPKDSATFAFIKIMAMKCKEGGKYATVIPSIKISQYSYEGCILESQLSRNICKEDQHK